MNCYMCLYAGVSTAAVAVCRSCGAACCFDHLEERAHAGRGPGMLPELASSVEILCERCVALQSAPFMAAQGKMAESVPVSSALKPPAAARLPNAKEAVNAVEDLLGLAPTELPGGQHKGWRRFFGRWRDA